MTTPASQTLNHLPRHNLIETLILPLPQPMEKVCNDPRMYFTQFIIELLAGYVKTYIIVPSTIYGMPKNAFTEAGLQNIHSIQVPQVIRAGLGRGQGGMVGLGKNKWANVHIDDGELLKPNHENTN